MQRLLYADRSERAKLRLRGPQRAWFLHQIMTQAFDPLQQGEARAAAMLTPHGRMVGYLEAVATADAILAHFEPELEDTFPDAIRRYVFATQVEIEEVTEDYGLVLVVGDAWREAASKAAAGAPLHETPGLGVPAGYIWTARDQVREVTGLLEADAAREEELEAIRIANGVARWGRDMNERSMPMEARIEDFAVHFEKGCYVGQEAVAKIHFRGKVNRLLRRIEGDAELQVGSDVTLEGVKVGTVTSSAGANALAMLKHTVEPGTAVQTGDVAGKVIA